VPACAAGVLDLDQLVDYVAEVRKMDIVPVDEVRCAGARERSRARDYREHGRRQPAVGRRLLAVRGRGGCRARSVPQGVPHRLTRRGCYAALHSRSRQTLCRICRRGSWRV